MNYYTPYPGGIANN